MRGISRLAVAFGLTHCFWLGVSQQTGSDTPPDPAVYKSFFAQVVRLTQSIVVTKPPPLLINGQSSAPIVDGAGTVVWTPALAQPTAREAIGLTDQETLALNEVASDCQAKLDALKPATEHLVFEGRLERIRTEGTPAWLMQQLKDIERQRTQTVVEHIQRLKAAFGDARFEMLDSWVRSRKDAASFFPLVRQEIRQDHP
jgi:hypothetical protein